MKTKLAAASGALVVAGLAFAAVPVIAATSISMPAEQHQGAVGFISGGVGQAEAELFKKELTKHPLAIELLERGGKADEFTANAMVKVADLHGHTVLDAQANGPFMLVDLPPGRYSIQATLKNHTLKKSAVVVAHDKMAREIFEFPAHTDG
jgi:hypothetical protein